MALPMKTSGEANSAAQHIPTSRLVGSRRLSGASIGASGQ
ncbi:hypothetical protein BZL29_1523 [Mycobacterium kansasii]|uniref:Uncharacterized protein n=1 Tax=Mycobacterium kansasii TaxID=1768 RepID=A0A1V3XWJ8_MYCKA|nr:hypothetical protein BZL29_1523 [Mycobacterium kansasii]